MLPKSINNTEFSSTIYLAISDEFLASELSIKLDSAGYKVLHFSDWQAIEKACSKNLPAAVIMDGLFRAESDTGADIFHRLKSNGKVCAPLIYLSENDDVRFRLAAVKTGVHCFYSKPANHKKVIKMLDDMSEWLDERPNRILIIENDELLLDFYEVLLKEAGMEVKTLLNPFDCLEVLAEFKPDLVIVDVYMPECSGTELVQIIRQDEAWALIPIIYLSAENDTDIQLKAMEYGADDFIEKTVGNKRLVSIIKAMVKRARKSVKIHNELDAALREREFQLITMNQHDIVSTTNVAGTITSVNDKFCEISGYSREELIGKNHRLLKSSKHSKKFYKELWSIISSGKVWHGSICNHKKTGEEYWVESTIVPFLDEKGKPYKYVSARTDVTELRQSEERLRRSQEFAKIGNWDWNILTGEIYWSDHIWELFGYSKETTETTYENFLAAVYPEDRDSVITAVNSCVENDTEYNIEHRVTWPDNSIHWVQESGNVVRDDNGKPIHMLGVVQDIDSRKMSETRLKQSEQQLRNAQAISHTGNWQANIQTGALYWSDEIYRIFGFSPGSFEPNIDIFKKAIHPDDLSLVEQSEALAKQNGYHDVVHRIVRPNSEVRYVHELAKADFDAKGNLEYLTGTVQDITEEMIIKQQLISAREQAEAANHAKSKFLSNMSHELRTPMNAIMGFSQLLKFNKKDELSDTQLNSVDEIITASEHLLELINEILDLTKIEEGQLEFSIQGVKWGEVLVESLQLIEPLSDKRGIQVSVVEKDSVITTDSLMQQADAVLADRTRLKQALLNLLSNAVKYNCDNGEIIIRCENQENGLTRISITDTGNGLTNEQLEQLFKPFNRLGVDENDVEGVGIGLVITKSIIEYMGGNIGVESNHGKGSTFWIELPADKNHISQSEKEIKVSDKETTDSISTDKEHTVLYIEDNPANMRLVSQLLNRQANINLIGAPEPVEGLKLAAEYQPSLVLLDINLPRMNGFEVLQELRQHTETRDTPVIAISANAMPKDVQKGIDAGFIDYITKPIDLKALLNAVDRNIA